MNQLSLVTLDHDEPDPPEGTGLLARLGRRKLLCALGFGLTAAVVAVTFSALPPTYRASAALMVASNEAVLRSSDSSAEAQRLGDPADIESQMLMLRSPRLARVILDDPKVTQALLEDCEATRRGTWFTQLKALALKPGSCDPKGMNIQAGLERLESGFSIGPTGRSRVIEVSFVSPVPDTAVVVANALVDAYLDDDKARKVATHDAAINWLTADIAKSGEELRAAELEIEKYRADHGIVRGQQAPITSENLTAAAREKAEAEAAYALATSRLNQSTGDGNVQEMLSNPTISDLTSRLATQQAHYAELRQQYGDNYPAVRAANGQLRELAGQLDQERRRIGASLQHDAKAAAARLADANARYDSLVKQVGTTGGAEAGMAIMVSDIQARSQIYLDEKKKLNELQTERRLLEGDSRLVNHAELPERPWFPKKMPFVAVGTVLAAVVGAGAGLVRDRGDRTLRGSTNLPQLAGVPIVGYIPWVRQRRGARWPLVHLRNATPLQESIRALYSRFVLVPGQAPKTLMIASSEIAEGKTFLALALALFAVAAKRQVLVIEGDLRRPSFRTALNLADGPGLAEYLRGEANASDVIVSYRGLHILAAGRPCVDSTELLGRGNLDMLLEAAVLKYDLVILDSPPTLSLMDAQVLARRVDGIVYCASYGRSRLDRVTQGIRSLGRAGGNVLGIVISGGPGAELPRYDTPGLLTGSYLPEGR